MSMRPGPRNLITDVSGLKVGNAEDHAVKTGATVLVGDKPFVTGAHVMGGAPGTRETDLLAPDKTVQEVDAITLAGGSAFGLDAASGVADALRDQGRGFPVGNITVPIVPGAIVFDLLNGGAKDWGGSFYKDLGRAALGNATADFTLGSVGAGTGTLIADLKGGLGSASIRVGDFTVGALVAVNALGRVTVGEGPHFWAGPFEMDKEFGGRGTAPSDAFDPAELPPFKGGEQQATVIAIVATDARMDQAQATRMATTAHDGIARAVLPSHTPMDGDIVFAVSTGEVAMESPVPQSLLLGHAAAVCLSRAIARGVYAATGAEGDLLPTWQEKFGKSG